VSLTKPKRLYVVWPKPTARPMPKKLRHPDAFTTRALAEDNKLDDEDVIVYVLHEDYTRARRRDATTIALIQLATGRARRFGTAKKGGD